MKFKKIIWGLFIATLMFACETNNIDLVDDAVTLSESKSSAAKGPPEFSGKVIREVFPVGFIVLDEDTGLTALFGWDTETLWPPENLESITYKWIDKPVGWNAMSHGELGAMVFVGTPIWPFDGACSNCEEFFADPTLLAEGTAHFTYHENVNSYGGRFNGRLTDGDGDIVNLSAWFDWFKGEWDEYVKLR